MKKKIHNNIRDKSKIKTNFNYLKKFIDFDKNHINLLNEEYENSRYQDISTYKYNNVKLNSKIYINASFINLPSNKFFIATQGPLLHTIDHFWEMVWEYDVNYIVMLCELKEGGREKCAEYWNQNNSKLFRIKVEEKKVDNFLIKRKFKIYYNNDSKIVNQLHFIGWPDHGVPDVKTVYNTFRYMIDEVKFNGKKPVVVHCSAGVGRTGTFITMFNIVDEIEKQKEKDVIYINIFNLVRKLKEMRIYLVENILQYEFVHNFVILYVNKNLFVPK